MRIALAAFTATLIASSALAQAPTTIISTSPAATTTTPELAPAAPPAGDAISSSTLEPHPFNPQKPMGDGVAITPGTASTIVAPTPPKAPIMGATAQPPAPPAGGAPSMSKAFDEADTNRDGVVTREEFIAKAERHFGMADTDKDGKITRAEMQTQEQKMMQQMRQRLLGGIDKFMGSPTPANAAPAAGSVMIPSVPAAPMVTSPAAPAINQPKPPIVIPVEQ